MADTERPAGSSSASNRENEYGQDVLCGRGDVESDILYSSEVKP